MQVYCASQLHDVHPLPQNSHPFFAPIVLRKTAVGKICNYVDGWLIFFFKTETVWCVCFQSYSFTRSIHSTNIATYFSSLKVFKIRHLWTIVNLTLVHRKILFTPSVRYFTFFAYCYLPFIGPLSFTCPNSRLKRSFQKCPFRMTIGLIPLKYLIAVPKKRSRCWELTFQVKAKVRKPIWVKVTVKSIHLMNQALFLRQQRYDVFW